MDRNSVRYLSDKQIANAVNAQKRRCRIGKVLPRPVAVGRDAFRRVLVESGVAPEDRFDRKFGDARLDAAFRIDEHGVVWNRRTGENLTERLRRIDEAVSQ